MECQIPMFNCELIAKFCSDFSGPNSIVEATDEWLKPKRNLVALVSRGVERRRGFFIVDDSHFQTLLGHDVAFANIGLYPLLIIAQQRKLHYVGAYNNNPALGTTSRFAFHANSQVCEITPNHLTMRRLGLDPCQYPSNLIYQIEVEAGTDPTTFEKAKILLQKIHKIASDQGYNVIPSHHTRKSEYYISNISNYNGRAH
jgi:hypothetical protein